ncbi:thiamine pyrophosphate-dependent enzyme [Halovivax limisalsi]|uniref:thiamine pyrophosphate-dependent enzyme n=1 Tax=Halovivax limisalsi TaxID=1453760 RepID=UPI001FFD5D95|nr:thiamine pyrophosphate-dependent enzyme [Halovivax limisalsi]
MDESVRREPVDGAAEAYLRVFADQGVEYFFNSPGSDDSPYWEFLAKHDATEESTARSVPTHMNCRHEDVAVNMARGYTTMTGDPQVVKLHGSSGPLHAAMDINTAYQSSVPMLLLGSHSATHENEQFGGTAGPYYFGYHPPGGHENNVARYTKWIANLDTNDNAERRLARAFRIANASPEGPVLLNISMELSHDRDKTEVHLPELAPATPPAPDEDAIERIVSTLEAAANPVILTSRLGRSNADRAALVDLAEHLHTPVFETQRKTNNFPMDHPLYMGATLDQPGADELYHHSDVDLVLVLDAKTPWYPPHDGAPSDAEIVVVHEEPVQEKFGYWNYPADLLVTAAPSRLLATLRERTAAHEGSRSIDWSAAHDAWQRRWDGAIRAGERKTPIDPCLLCHTVNETLPRDAMVFHEVIVHTPAVSNIVGSHGRNDLFVSRANRGGLGTGLSVALGAKLARPDRLATVLMGDGSFHYNSVVAALGTAQEYDLPLLVVLFNNGAYESMKFSLQQRYGDGWAEQTDTYYGSAIEPDPDYASVADVWDGFGATVADPDALESTLSAAIDAVEAGDVAIVDVRVEDGIPDYPTP